LEPREGEGDTESKRGREEKEIKRERGRDGGKERKPTGKLGYETTMITMTIM
jgi:hypothetical protein